MLYTSSRSAGVGDGLDARLERDDLVVAGGDHDGAELEALRKVRLHFSL